MPVGIVDWELFAPERYSMKSIGGNAIDLNRLRADNIAVSGTSFGVEGGVSGGVAGGVASPMSRVIMDNVVDGRNGQIRGVARDGSGAVIPGVTVEVASSGTVKTAVTDRNGQFVFSDVPSGSTTVTATLSGFATARYAFTYDQRPREIGVQLHVSNQLEETITVTAESPRVDLQTSRQIVAPSQNVVDLQRKATGVLPVRIDVPRAGTSHQFVKPLVVDQETTVRLRYKRR